MPLGQGSSFYRPVRLYPFIFGVRPVVADCDKNLKATQASTDERSMA